ncbi:MAG: fructosamine kinase family protein [Gemmatimonadetes bacterium]|nr:fructosamine kinase family protein [Gemmatimonadota bacterium]
MTAKEPQIEELLDHRDEIEASVSAHLGHEWGISEIQDLAEKSSHPSAVLSDGEFGVFAKLGRGRCAAEQFRCETVGLSAMSAMAGVLTPTVVACLLIPNGALLVLKAVRIIERTKTAWEEAGRSLARLHAVKGPRFGFDEDSYWGDFRQNNRPLDSWNAFFWERWIEPRIAYGLDKGLLTVDLAREVERLARRLDTVCGLCVDPSLVHGDAHQNNILSTSEGPVFVDPNVHFGHPELDLAFVDYFQPVPEALFSAYAEMLPIDEDFSDRRELWRMPFYLTMVEGHEGIPQDQIRAVLDRFL